MDLRTKADILVEFLEVAFHSVLYYRNIYPKSIFGLMKKYQIPVHVSKFPEINNYITECLKTARVILNQDGLKQIAMVIVTEFEVPLERYCFDLEPSDVGISDIHFVKTEEIFRHYLLKLSVADFNELPENCTFRIQISTTELCSVQLNETVEQEHFPWIEAEKEEAVEQNFEIFPVKTLNTSLLKLNMYIERGSEIFSKGIKFSSESLAEISILAEKGKNHLERMREKANVPQFGPCWKSAISDLQIGCKFLSENVQSDLALRFTDCFLRMSGHEPLICDLPKASCLKKLSDRAFNAYTEFYTHTQSICYFLQSQIWHEETEKTIDKLSSTSLQVSKKLEEASEIQEKLLYQQKESLLLQHDLNNSSKNVASVLQVSQDKINLFMKDFQITAAEQKELLMKLFENLILFKSWAVNELSWFNSTVYFATATLIIFLFTSVSRTRDARMVLFIIFAINYFCERLLTSSIQANVLGDYFKIAPDSLNAYIWLCRKFCVSLSVIILLWTAFNYSDYNIRNYELLLEIKKQNLKILDFFSLPTESQNILTKSNTSHVNMLNQFCSTTKGWNDNLNVLYTGGNNNQPKSYDFSDKFYSSSLTVNSSKFVSKDVTDCEESVPLDIATVTSEKESTPKQFICSYNLRNCKSRKTVFS